MPLIKNEKTIPISLVEKKHSQEQKQSDWHPNYDMLITEALGATGPVKLEENKTFVPSTLFDKQFRSSLVKVFMEKQGEESPDEATKMLNANWSLVHENTVSRPGSGRWKEFGASI